MLLEVKIDNPYDQSNHVVLINHKGPASSLFRAGSTLTSWLVGLLRFGIGEFYFFNREILYASIERNDHANGRVGSNPIILNMHALL